MSNDPAIDAVRDARRKISERVGHDPQKLIEYYKQLQERHRDRFVEAKNQDSESTGETAA